MRPLSLGLLAWDYPPAASGLAVAAREIAESLVEAGHHVRVFALDRTGAEPIGGVAVLGCRPTDGSTQSKLRRLGGVGHLVAPAAFLGAVRRAHRERPFDLVEATNWYAPAALLHRFTAIPVVTRHSTPAIFTGIADAPKAAPRSFRDRFDGGCAAALEAYSARASAGSISNTLAHARTIAEIYGLAGEQRAGHPAGRHAVVGLSLPNARLRRGRSASYPEATEGPLRLLFVGRAERRKGFDLLTGALEILSQEIRHGQTPGFEMRVVGVAARDLPGMSPQARALIALTGRLDEDELDGEYERCHGVVAPSRYESFGLVYQEALAFGRPVVALAEDASACEFVGATGAGLLAQSSATALADAMARLLRSTESRLALRARALDAAGRFDRASLAAETLALYRTVLQHSRRDPAQGR